MKSSVKRDEALESYPKRRSYLDYHDFAEQFDGATQMASYEFLSLPVDFLFAANPSSHRLAVFFNSQQRPDSLRLFTWQKVAKSFSAHRLFIADSLVSANQSLNLGWYLGSRTANLQSHLKALIRHVAQSLGVEDIIFFGSSGGGFPAIYYSQVFDDSLAVTLAPTTTVLHHSNRKLVGAWEDASEYRVASDSNSDSSGDVLHLDLPSLYQPSLRNPVIILQNSGDSDFIESQTVPLIDSQGTSLSTPALDFNNLHLRLESYGEGHRPPPSDRVTRLAETISAIPLGGLGTALYGECLDATLA